MSQRKPLTGARVLGIETGGDHLAVALLAVADTAPHAITLVDEVTSRRGDQLADSVLVLVADLLERHGIRPAELALIGVGRGPGSFTGIRVALATAKGLSTATGVPAWPVCSLRALACHATAGLVLPLFDARRGEVYAGLFRAADTTSTPPAIVTAPHATSAVAAVASAREVAGGEPLLVIGSGALAYDLASPVGPAAHVGAARHVAWLAALEWLAGGRDGRAAPPLDAAYLRRSEAEVAADARDARDAVSAGG